MKLTATVLSHIFQPLFIPLYGILLFFYVSPFALLPVSLPYKLLTLGGTFFFTALIPGLSVLYMMKTGQVSDIFISNRRQRTLPYVYTLISYLFWIYFLWQTMLLSTLLVLVAAGAVVGLILVMIINIKWKISAHLTGMGSLFGASLGFSYVFFLNPLPYFLILLLLSLSVMWSRIYLKAHTPMQVVGGFYVGMFTTFLPCILFTC